MWIRAILVVVLVGLLIRYFLKLLNMYKMYPPGPPVLLIAVKFIMAGFRVYPEMFSEVAKQYGGIYTIWGLHIPVIVVSGLQALQEVFLKHSEVFSGRPVTPFIQHISGGKGLLFSNGHTWKQQRKFGVTTLRMLGLGKKGVESDIQDEAYELVQTFARAKGQPVEPALPLSNSSSNVICALVFRHRYSIDDEEFIRLTAAHAVSLEFPCSIPHLLYEAAPWLARRLKWLHQKVFDSVFLVLSHAKEQVEIHRQQLAVHNPRDFIDYYLLQMEKSKNDPTSTFDIDNLAQAVSDLFSAGTSTISSTMQWALFLIASFPDIQEKVQKELDDAFGSSQIISYQDRKNVPYTWAVIHEIQRFKYIVLAGKPRQCLQDVTILGRFIPKGTLLVPDLHSALLDPKIWETPQKFNPNHFLDEDGKFMDRDEFIIFGVGARMCIGKELAKMEIFVFFTSLLRAFTFKLPKGEIAKPTRGAQLTPQPYKICAIPRFSES